MDDHQRGPQLVFLLGGEPEQLQTLFQIGILQDGKLFFFPGRDSQV